MKKLPNADYLKECFHYDSESGVLRWKNRPPSHFKTEKEWLRFSTTKAGKETASCVQCYRRVQLDGQTYRVHRIIWKMMTGEEPGDFQINHIDGNKVNNTWSNLELTTAKENIRHAHLSGLAKGMRGSSHPNSRLTKHDVEEIRSLRNQNIKVRVIAEKYNISTSHVYSIVKKHRWKEEEND